MTLPRRDLLKLSAPLLLGSQGIFHLGCESEKKDKAQGDIPELQKKDSAELRNLLSEIMLVIVAAEPASKTIMRAHLNAVLEDERMKHFHPLLFSGASFLHRLSFVRHKKSFATLKQAEKEELMLAMAQRKVRPPRFRPDLFIKVMISVTLEAALKDSEPALAMGYRARR